jgi:transcriptional regulator with XRE-family HTH domain
MYQTTNINGLLELMKTLQRDKTQKEYAKELGVSPQYLNDVYNFRRDPGKTILTSLGAQKAFVIPDTLCHTAAMTSQENTNASSQESSSKKVKASAKGHHKKR